MRFVYIFYGRFPSEKAAALYTSAAMESFAELGHECLILASHRRFVGGEEALALPKNVELMYIPTLDIYRIPVLSHIAHYIAMLSFSVSAWWYLWRYGKSDDVVFSHELWPLYAASFVVRNTVYEMHDFPEHYARLVRHVLRRFWRILSTNTWKAGALEERFGIIKERIFVEPNGVNVAQFDISETRKQAREKLGLPDDRHIALYTGHLYSWKGVDALAQAGEQLSDADVYVVGGTEKDVEAFRKKYGHIQNLKVLGHRPHADMPLWLRAADVLILPNTAKEEISAKYTSPMKLFEYMASGTPIVASKLESIEHIVSSEQVRFVTPDDPAELADAIEQSTRDANSVMRAQVAKAKVATHSWTARAKRIVAQL